jgi:AcrR family transcriptional regulator
LRNLADRLDMRVGNLTYHYNSKADLLQAMMGVHQANYAEGILALLQITGSSPRDALEKVVTYLVQDLRGPEIAFFVQLWTLALHDDFAAEQVDRLHELERLVIASLIHSTRPDWEPYACGALALNVTATIEGLTIFIGRNRKSEGIFAAPEQEIIRILRQLL